MFGEPLSGGALPSGTLCLTFDDGPGATARPGPGPRTLELARYLADEEVPATFFLSGKHMLGLPDVNDAIILSNAVPSVAPMVVPLADRGASLTLAVLPALALLPSMSLMLIPSA